MFTCVGEFSLICGFKLNTQTPCLLSALHVPVLRLSGSSAVPNKKPPPHLATPGVCEATHIFPAAQDGDLALSHFHWKTTASGYHRCQQGARGVALAMMLLAAAAAEVGETCFAFIFCLASLAGLLRDATLPSRRPSALPAKAKCSIMCVHI